MKKGTHHTEIAKEKNRQSHLGKPRAGNPENWKHTKKTKEKMREIKLANPVRYWLGKSRSKKTKEKLRQKALEQFKDGMSLKTRKKISKKLKGRKGRIWTEEERKQHGERLKGRIPWNKGLKGYNAGEKHHMWKGGSTSLDKLANKLRQGWKYRQWREEILLRDNYTCQKCEKKGGKLEVHHSKIEFINILIKNGIKTHKEAMGCEELWDKDNGETLCLDCHNLTKHGRNTKKKT